MKLKMIVLSAKQGTAVAQGPIVKPNVFPHDPTELVAKPRAKRSDRVTAHDVKADVVETTPEDRADLARDPTNLAMAPVMPVRLVKQLASKAAAAKGLKMSWGIEAVGAAGLKGAGAGVTVAVLDTGIDRGHEAFKGLDFFDLDQEPGKPKNAQSLLKNFTKEGGRDTDGHGTHCAGTIFGRDVEGCRIGVATGVDRVLIGKVLGDGGGSSESINQAILWALQNGAHVISMSLGLDFPGFQKELMAQGLPAEQATSVALQGYRQNLRLFERLGDLASGPDGITKGAIVVAAAGNESNRPGFTITVAPPAVGERILAVGALGLSGDPKKPYEIARFSNDDVDIAAPGVDIVSAKVGGGLVSYDGTSMAGPHVAGVAAVIAEPMIASGGYTADKVIKRIDKQSKTLGYLLDADVGVGLASAI